MGLPPKGLDYIIRIESYPLVASSQHVDAAAAVTVLQLEFMLVEQ